MRIVPSVLAVLALAAPAAVVAQEPAFSVSAGYGVTQSDALSGPAAHLRLAVPLAQVGRRASLHAEAMVQQGTINGPPSTCRRVGELDCTGRSDRNRIVSAGTYLRLDLGRGNGRLRAYVTPLGAGFYQRRTETEEYQAPTRICVGDAVIEPCANALPFARVSSHRAETSLGVNLGGGLELRTGGVRLFVDARVHRMLEGSGSWAGAAPLSMGVSF